MKIEYPPVPDNSLFKFNADSNEWFVQMKNGLQFFIGDSRTEPEMHQILCDHMYRCWIDIAHGLGEKCDESDAITKYGIDQHMCHVTGYRDAHINAELWHKLGKEMK